MRYLRPVKWPGAIIICFLLVAGACRGHKQPEHRQALSPDLLVEINRELVIKEKERIESYISRKGLDMKFDSTGFWYKIIEHGSDTLLTEGDRVSLEYECSMLDGTLCYSSDRDGNLDVVIGNTDIPGGLDAALRLVGNKGEAMVILPNNLAYGLPGDGKRIPSRAALIYSFKVSKN